MTRLRAAAVLNGLGMAMLGFAVVGCHTTPPGKPLTRTGDEIIVAGQMFHTGTRVVTWMDPEGYDAYRVERRFSDLSKADWESSKAEVKYLETPNRYNLRKAGLTDEEIEKLRGGGWDLPTLQKVVDQFVLHYDVCGTSRQCFKVLHDMRGLSVHFMLDIDGTIYQTLDLKERAWHATTSNSRSVGIEIANMGAYPATSTKPLEEWYTKDSKGQTRIAIPERLGDGGVLTKNFVGHPARNDLVEGNVQGRDLVQYDFTPEQYAALVKLTATLAKVFPKIKCDYPRDEHGKLVTHKLSDEQLQTVTGVIGHLHIQTNKVDPGPAFQWDHVLGGARKLLNRGMSDPAHQTSQGHLRSAIK